MIFFPFFSTFESSIYLFSVFLMELGLMWLYLFFIWLAPWSCRGTGAALGRVFSSRTTAQHQMPHQKTSHRPVPSIKMLPPKNSAHLTLAHDIPRFRAVHWSKGSIQLSLMFWLLEEILSASGCWAWKSTRRELSFVIPHIPPCGNISPSLLLDPPPSCHWPGLSFFLKTLGVALSSQRSCEGRCTADHVAWPVLRDVTYGY